MQLRRCCPFWQSGEPPSCWWAKTVTHLGSKAFLLKWKRPQTLRSLDPSDHTSPSKALLFTSTHLEPQVWQGRRDGMDDGQTSSVPQMSLLCASGLPKAAVLNQNRLLSALAVLSSNGITSKDIFYLNLPLYHTAGFIVGFIGCIETGETIQRYLWWLYLIYSRNTQMGESCFCSIACSLMKKGEGTFK